MINNENNCYTKNNLEWKIWKCEYLIEIVILIITIILFKIKYLQFGKGGICCLVFSFSILKEISTTLCETFVSDVRLYTLIFFLNYF